MCISDADRRDIHLLYRISVPGGNGRKGVTGGGDIMLNYEEELKKFQPSLEVEDIEEAVYKEDLTDMQDIIREAVEQTK